MVFMQLLPHFCTQNGFSVYLRLRSWLHILGQHLEGQALCQTPILGPRNLKRAFPRKGGGSVDDHCTAESSRLEGDRWGFCLLPAQTVSAARRAAQTLPENEKAMSPACFPLLSPPDLAGTTLCPAGGACRLPDYQANPLT